MFEYDKYYRDCQQQNKPFIKAKTNPLHGNYYVQLDLMPCTFELSDKTQKQIHELVQSEIQHVENHLKYSFEGFSINKELAWFDGISSEHVDNFCNSLYDISAANCD